MRRTSRLRVDRPHPLRPRPRPRRRRGAVRACGRSSISQRRASSTSTAASGARARSRATRATACGSRRSGCSALLAGLWLARRRQLDATAPAPSTRAHDLPDGEPDDRLRPHRQPRPQGSLAPAAAGACPRVRRRPGVPAVESLRRRLRRRIAPSPPARPRRASGWSRRPCSRRRRGARAAIAAAVVYGVATSALRVAFGGHFLSDVLFGGLISLDHGDGAMAAIRSDSGST